VVASVGGAEQGGDPLVDVVSLALGGNELEGSELADAGTALEGPSMDIFLLTTSNVFNNLLLAPKAATPFASSDGSSRTTISRHVKPSKFDVYLCSLSVLSQAGTSSNNSGSISSSRKELTLPILEALFIPLLFNPLLLSPLLFSPLLFSPLLFNPPLLNALPGYFVDGARQLFDPTGWGRAFCCCVCGCHWGCGMPSRPC
jgi:hypothetical protein